LNNRQISNLHPPIHLSTTIGHPVQLKEHKQIPEARSAVTIIYTKCRASNKPQIKGHGQPSEENAKEYYSRALHR